MSYEPNHIVCYLAGFIANDVMDKCVGWRNQIINHYTNWKGAGLPYPIVFLNPLNGEDFSKISGDGLKGCFPPNAIFWKDYKSIEKSDIIIANMDTFGMSRAPIGTISELTIAWMLKKPIILITNNDTYKNHPFISYFTCWQIETVEELLEKKVINKFYKAWNTSLIERT